MREEPRWLSGRFTTGYGPLAPPAAESTLGVMVALIASRLYRCSRCCIRCSCCVLSARACGSPGSPACCLGCAPSSSATGTISSGCIRRSDTVRLLPGCAPGPPRGSCRRSRRRFSHSASASTSPEGGGLGSRASNSSSGGSGAAAMPADGGGSASAALGALDRESRELAPSRSPVPRESIRASGVLR